MAALTSYASPWPLGKLLRVLCSVVLLFFVSVDSFPWYDALLLIIISIFSFLMMY
jgi:hypothetical protein